MCCGRQYYATIKMSFMEWSCIIWNFLFALWCWRLTCFELWGILHFQLRDAQLVLRDGIDFVLILFSGADVVVMEKNVCILGKKSIKIFHSGVLQSQLAVKLFRGENSWESIEKHRKILTFGESDQKRKKIQNKNLKEHVSMMARTSLIPPPASVFV